MHLLKQKQTVFPKTETKVPAVFVCKRTRRYISTDNGGINPKERKIRSYIKKVQDLRFLVEQKKRHLKKKKRIN